MAKKEANRREALWMDDWKSGEGVKNFLKKGPGEGKKIFLNPFYTGYSEQDSSSLSQRFEIPQRIDFQGDLMFFEITVHLFVVAVFHPLEQIVLRRPAQDLALFLGDPEDA